MKAKRKKPPAVRMACPRGRPIQLRYFDREQGREVRLSTGTRDEAEAGRQKAELEARLLLGLRDDRRGKMPAGPRMPWQAFRERYTEVQLATLRSTSAVDAESRLDIAERILKPRTLGDVATPDALHTLQTRLLAGSESRFGRPRSPHTVRSYMAAVLAALNWAVYMEWLPTVPRVRRVKVSKLRQMKGRPLALEEFERLLLACPKVVGTSAAPSWDYILRGLWESGLRIGELMAMHWTDPNLIRPVWPRCGQPVLEIPHELQKNDTEEAIPLLPGFEALLLETLPGDCHGWVFRPGSLHPKVGRKPWKARPRAEWVAKVVGAIGRKAGVIVTPADPPHKVPAKFASAHDLRRSCAQRLDDAGLPEPDIMRVMRHRQRETLRRHYAPGTVQKSAARIREYLGTPAMAD